VFGDVYAYGGAGTSLSIYTCVIYSNMYICVNSSGSIGLQFCVCVCVCVMMVCAVC